MTIEDHIWERRLDLKLPQSEVAAMMQIDEMTVVRLNGRSPCQSGDHIERAKIPEND